MSSQETIRVIVADDHPIFREGMVLILNNQPDITVVGEFGNGSDALRAVSELSPDVAILDLKMPDMSGAAVASVILERLPKCRILILTTFGGADDIQRAMRAGAHGYLLKESRKDEVLRAIREVAQGRLYLSQAVGISFAGAARMRDLTKREREILSLISVGKTNKEIGSTLRITESTVKSHVNGILQKLNSGSRTEAAFVALQHGLLRD